MKIARKVGRATWILAAAAFGCMIGVPMSLGQTARISLKIGSAEVPPFAPADIFITPPPPPETPAVTFGLGPGDELDALSRGEDLVFNFVLDLTLIPLYYSIDGLSVGRDAVIKNETGPGGNGARGDIFNITKPAGIPGWTAPRKYKDAVGLGLTPSPGPGESEVDALNIQHPGCTRGYYFSVDPAVGGGHDPATVYFVDFVTGAKKVYAAPAALGLVPKLDDIDALMVWDQGAIGVLDAGDYVFGSLTRASVSAGALGSATVIQFYPPPTQTVLSAATFGLLPGDDIDGLSAFDPPADDDGFEDGGGGSCPGDPVLWSGLKRNLIDSGWVVTSPTGSADYFDATYGVIPGITNVENGVLAGGLPIRCIAVSVADFGSGRTYPILGVFNSNLGLDPSGQTPDLHSPVAAVASPTLGAPPLFEFETFGGVVGSIPPGSSAVHVVGQLPPGDSGLLGIGADSTASATGNSGFTTDGYSTPSISASFLDFGLNPGQDNSATTSCKSSDRLPHGRLRASNLKQGIGEGDRLTAEIRGGDTLNLAFFGTKTGDKFRLYFNVAPCAPAVAIGPLLPTLPDPDGDGTFIRLNATWPTGYGGNTFRFSALWGNGACASPGVGFTNCVTVITLPDPTFGICDDGTIESGWVVSVPSGPSDLFNNDFGLGTGQHGVVGLTIAVLDFGTATPAFPRAGVSNANFVVDATGHTPDVSGAGLLALIAPFTFPSGTLATTSGLYVNHAVAVPGASLGTHVHGWVQFPPGDSGLLGVGGDTTMSNGCSFFTLDSYTTPAVSFFANWGIRLKTN
ncbi:MAG: hypothetical protein U1E76_02685 [Planctomycetota bacterium]